MKQMPLVASFVLFIALCVSIAYWGMQLFKPETRAVVPPQQPAQPEVRVESAAMLFGGRPAAMAAATASNYELKGILMSGTAGESTAILSADGKPAVATAVGKEVMPGVVVKEVHPLYVVLSENGVNKRVDLPESARTHSGISGIAPVSTQPAANNLSQPGYPPVPPGNMPPGIAGEPPPPGMTSLPGYAGAPPVVQSSPEGQPPVTGNDGMGNVPAPGPRP